MPPDEERYSTEFFEWLAPSSRRSAAAMVGEIERFVRPDSILDVGCGVGSWLAEWRSRGVTDVLGIDGDYVSREWLEIPAENFKAMDLLELSEPFDLGRQFGLVQSLEVAEHLEEHNAASLVASLVRHSETILFSAAIPGQGGVHHVNEQWPSYWIGLFAEHGFLPYDCIRPRVWADQRIDWWYRQNALLFARTESFGTSGAADLVHPELWQIRQQNDEVGLREWLRELFPTIRGTIGRRLTRR